MANLKLISDHSERARYHTGELHQHVVEGVPCVLVPIYWVDVSNVNEYVCKVAQCPRHANGHCSVDDDLDGYKFIRECYEPYNGVWAPASVFAVARLSE